MDEYDIAIIGGGPGGYVAAIRAAQLGFKTVCIEKRETFGGTCLNVGCIPSKALLQSSEHVAFLNSHAKDHGITCGEHSFDFSKMQSRKEDVVGQLVNGVSGLLKRNKVKMVQGVARFTSATTLDVVHENSSQKITAKHFILATGSTPIELPFLPFDEKVVVSSTGALNFTQVPKKLAVIGAGVIGVELASVYARLGSEVTVIEALDRICFPMDSKICLMLQKELAKQGLIFHLNARVEGAKVSTNGVELNVLVGEKKQVFSADAVLVAVGRRPYSEGLGLDEIGVKKDGKGFIEIDSGFQTSIANIYAIGDLVDGPMLAHKASEEGVVAVELIAGLHSHINYMTIPGVVYTHPEVASVGMSEEEAKSAGLTTMIGNASFKGNSRAKCAGDTDGMAKVVADKASGRLLGLHIVGPNASEMIGEGVIALENRMSVESIANTSHAHPTLSESIKEAALNALGRAIHI